MNVEELEVANKKMHELCDKVVAENTKLKTDLHVLVVVCYALLTCWSLQSQEEKSRRSSVVTH